jgi:hypothetical protein
MATSPVNQNPRETPAPGGFPWRTLALTLASLVVILVGFIAILYRCGWRFQPGDQATGGQLSGASAEKWSPPVPGESAAHRVSRLARDVAALSVAPTNRPNPHKVLDEARDLVRKGQYEEALQRHIWFHNHALEYDSGLSGVRLSFALSDWLELSRKYPKARQALVEIRDQESARFAEGKGYFELFQDVQAINRELQQDDDTLALFKSIAKSDPDLARHCYYSAEALLLRKGEYELCLSLYPDSQARFAVIRQIWESTANRHSGNARLKDAMDRNFVALTRALIEILVATNHKSDAEKILAQAISLMNDPLLDSAIQDAEKNLAKQRL